MWGFWVISFHTKSYHKLEIPKLYNCMICMCMSTCFLLIYPAILFLLPYPPCWLFCLFIPKVEIIISNSNPMKFTQMIVTWFVLLKPLKYYIKSCLNINLGVIVNHHGYYYLQKWVISILFIYHRNKSLYYFQIGVHTNYTYNLLTFWEV